MMEMKEQTGSRKKYLAPVVVLMLCLVALTGAAYAYASSFTVQDNQIGAEDFVLEVNKNGGGLITDPIAVKGIDFTTDTVLGSPNSVDVVAHLLANNGYMGSLTITDSDAADGATTLAVTAQVSVGGGDYAASGSGTITASEVTGSTGGPINYTVAVALYTNEACTSAYTNSVTFASHAATLYYKVSVTAASGSLSFASADPMTCLDAVLDQLEDETFNLKFVATAPGTA